MHWPGAGACLAVGALADLGFSAGACQCSRLNPHNRVNCGFPGISGDDCFSRGCCFGLQRRWGPLVFQLSRSKVTGKVLLSPGLQPRTQLPQAP